MQYLGKVLELHFVEYGQDHYYAYVSLTLGEEKVEFKWQLDDGTGERLSEIVEPGSRHKYRLSLQCYRNKRGTGYLSTLSKISGERTEQIYFNCSEGYAKNISWINQVTSLKELGSIKKAKKRPNITKRASIGTKNTFKERFKLVAATVITVISLAGFSLLAFMNSSSASNSPETNVSASVSDFDTPDTSFDEPEQEKVSTPENDRIAESESEEKDLERTSKDEEKTTDVEQDLPRGMGQLENPPLASVLKTDLDVTYGLDKGYVALTFDDGPSAYTKQIVDILTAYNVGGTFFFIGDKVKKNREQVKYAHEHGLSIGNHSMTHSDLKQKTAVGQLEELHSTNELLEEIIHEPIKLFRPPYGSVNQEMIHLFKEQNIKTIMWNKDPQDWKSRNTNAILNYTLASEGSGSIYVFHEIEETVEALPKIIEYFQSQGLEIVSLR